MESAAARTTFVRSLRLLSLPAVAALLGACVAAPPLAATRNQIIISVRDQKLTLVKEDHTRIAFPISTSKFGLGDRRGTYATPTGEMAVAAKIGGGKPAGTVFHGRMSTGEIVKIDAPGRDAIVTRILALRGLEKTNEHAFSRGIYIHGTPEERNIGRPTSYGCIRMRSRDVIQVFDMVNVGARVQIIDSTQNQAIASNILTPPPDSPAGASPNAALAAAEAASTGKPAAVTPAAAATTAAEAASTGKPAAAPPAAAATTAAATPAPKGKPAATVPAATAATATPTATPAAKGKKVWVGSPGQLLAKQNATEAKNRKDAKPPVGAPASARPVSNDEGSSKALNRSVFDSL